MRLRPYYTPMLIRLQFVARETIKTMSVDSRGRVYYNDGFVSFTKVDKLVVLLLQIVEQLLRHQGMRRRGRNPQLWSIACLLETATSLQSQGFKMPRDSITPGKLKLKPQLSAEQYYRKLLAMDEIQLPFTMVDERGREVQTEVKLVFKDDKITALMPGSAMTGDTAKWEENPLDGMDFCLDPLLFAGIEEELRQLARELGEVRAGDTPDWLQRYADVSRSQINWRTQLSRLVGEMTNWGTGCSTYTWTSGVSLLADCVSDGILLPSYETTSPSVAMIVDTSSSMGQEELSRAQGEIDGILSAINVEDGLLVIPTDASAKEPQRVFHAGQIKLVGGGGTDLGKGLVAADKLTPRPEAVIIATDGYTPWPKKPPKNLNVVVLIVSDSWSRRQNQDQYQVPPWAKCVEMFPAA